MNETTTNFESQMGFFEKLVKDAIKYSKEAKDLINQGREKASLESTVNKLEEELARAHLFIEDLQYKEKTLTEKLNKTRGEYDSNLKRLKLDYEALHKQHSSLKSAYDELHSNNHNASNSVIFIKSVKELENLKIEMARLRKSYNEAIEELSTKEEVHESLKRTIMDLGEKADRYKNIVDSNNFRWKKENMGQY